jgi:RNA 3'-terminal phosphate cyclase (ATP)
MLTIDGDMGEGGGQVLRTALTLSLCKQKAFRITNIRKRRRKPGLQRQHLAAVEAAAAISRAAIEGAEIGSQELLFTPRGVIADNYRFAIGTAGSTTLVAQTILPPLMLAHGPSTITLEGGTHNPLAPPFDFLEQVFCPLLNRMGPKVTARLERPGFYPRGGGIIHLEIQPAITLQPLALTERGKIQRLHAVILLARLPEHIAERERNVITQLSGMADEQVMIRHAETSPGPGNAIMITVASEHLTELFTSYGVRGVPAERVAETVVQEVQNYLKSGVPVGEHLADQLLIPTALAGGGAFITGRPSLHTMTNIEVINHFTGICLTTSEIETNKWRIGF